MKRCGDTRLEGGMHFTASVPAGENLCAGIGNTIADAFKALEQGKSPKFMVDYYQASDHSEKPRCGTSDNKNMIEPAKVPSASICSDSDNDTPKILAIVFGSLSGLLLALNAYILMVHVPKSIDQSPGINIKSEKKSRFYCSHVRDFPFSWSKITRHNK